MPSVKAGSHVGERRGCDAQQRHELLSRRPWRVRPVTAGVPHVLSFLLVSLRLWYSELIAYRKRAGD